MDSGISLGDLHQTPPQNERRPDRNRHYAVASYGQPAPGEFPIYIEMDVLSEMQAHAATDQSVELGGVMLGGQFEDEQGHPFVIITDSLRAKHYQSTKGSFKFTHDTWAQITRERDEFPDDLRMVGWYHTHPGWGVFLSGLDTFICDHFFNKPLDVALVIDPCRGDRGFFQWTGETSEPLRRTGGFYVIASRFRRYELEQYVAQQEGPITMQADPSARGYPPQPGTYPAPIVITQDRPGWLGGAVLATLVVQVCLILLIVWRLASPPPPPVGVDQQAQRQADRLDQQRRLLDSLVGEVDIAPDGLITTLQNEREKNEKLQTQLDAAQDAYAAAKRASQQLKQQRNTLQADLSEQQQELAMLSTKLEKLQIAADQESNPDATKSWWTSWPFLIGILIVALTAIAAVVTAIVRKKEPTKEQEEDKIMGRESE